MTEAILTVNDPAGLHARTIAPFYQAVRQFKSKITVQNISRSDGQEVPVTLLNLPRLQVKQGQQIRVRAEGDDEAAAIETLTRLVETNFGL